MKIVCRGGVYDLDWDATWKVCDLDGGTQNVLGHQHRVCRELRRTKVTEDSKRTGDFFVLEMADGDRYCRSKVRVTPLSPDEAASAAEAHVTYEEYVEFFGDPRGAEAEGDERVREAEREAKSAREGRDFWFREHNLVAAERDGLKDKLDRIQAKLDELEGGEA